MENTTWSNLSIHGNEFYADNVGAASGGTAAIYISQGPSANVYNNTFRQNKMSREIGLGHALSPGTTPQVVRIYNNSFWSWTAAILSETETKQANRSVYIENNIFYNTQNTATGIALKFSNDVEPLSLNNNIYFNPNRDASSQYVIHWMGVYKKFSEIQALGFETHGMYANPAYADLNKTPNSAVDLNLQAGSPAIGAGTDLSRFFTTDMAGTLRSDWDIGAFEHVDAGVDTMAPNAPGSIEVIE